MPFDTRRFLRNLLVAFVPAVLVWLVVTPFYNRFLLAAGENVVHLTESPDVTELLPAARDHHHGLITRRDFPPSRRLTHTFRVTDLHFHLVLLGALFLAVPGVLLRKRLADLGVAALVSVFFHLVLVLFWVQFVYATQLGAWSAENYGAFGQNFWGLGKHLLDLPFKLALPFVLWAAFHLDRLLPRRHREPNAP
ncbi:MAG TPA: hypothetical protein VHQ65_04705 [Thermoanaerobaculia bacterium]|nr:hypothetical protein [Thermoanaerobaculia bacterium]